MKKSIMLLFSVFCLNLSAFSLSLPEDFIKDGIGARPLGMGGAFTAMSGDLNSTFYNPAGLDSIPSFNYVTGNLDSSNGLTNSNLYSIFNFGALCFTSIARKDIGGDKVESDYFSFGDKGNYGFSYGLTYKNIRWQTGITSGIGYGADLGILSRVTPNFSLGLMFQDFAASKELNMPSTTRIGLSYRLFDDNLIFASDVEFGRTAPGNYTYYGAEWRTSDSFMLRGGSYRGIPTLGFGISLGILEVNYSVLYDKVAAGGSVHRFSVGTSFLEQKKRPFSIIRPKEFALIEVGGSLVGGIGEFSILGGGKIGADAIIAHIKDATEDPYVDGIILRIRSFEGGLGSLGIVQEIRKELKNSKAKGKKIIAYIESSALGDEYYLASAADYIVAPPNAFIGGIGKTIAITRIKGLLEKIGVDIQIIARGRYKTTFSMFQDGLTKDQEKMLKLTLSELYRQMIDDIGSDRTGISMEKLKSISDGGILSAKKAKELKLIDEIGYFKDAAKAGSKLMGKDDDPLIVERKDLLVRDEGDVLIAFPNKVAVIEINGDIVIGKSGQNILFGGKATGADTVTEQIKRAADDWQVKAIIVRINSGGGSAIASKQIYNELKKAKEKGKVIVASFGDIAASGGYYIASAADHIVSDPGTITGSIGVVGGEMPVIKDLLGKLGVKVEVLKEGEHSDMFSGLRRLSTKEVESLSAIMEETYQDFLSVVAEGRKFTTSEVNDVAEGKIYTGSQAKDLRLVDSLGNFSDAVDEAASRAGISGKPKLIYYREEGFWLGLGTGAVKALGLEEGLLPHLKTDLIEYKM